MTLAQTLFVIVVTSGFVVVGLSAGRKKYRRRQISKASLRWPKNSATFKGALIEKYEVGGEFGGVYHRLSVEFTYVVDETTYSGHYVESGFSEEGAQKMAGILEDGPLIIRYDPAAPQTYFVDPYRDPR